MLFLCKLFVTFHLQIPHSFSVFVTFPSGYQQLRPSQQYPGGGAGEESGAGKAPLGGAGGSGVMEDSSKTYAQGQAGWSASQYQSRMKVGYHS